MNIHTSVCDTNLKEIKIGDKVKLFNQVGTATFEAGAYGIGFTEIIDWDNLEKQIEATTGLTNTPRFLYNDNFISFWELLWNYDCTDDWCEVVEILSSKEGGQDAENY